MAIRYTQDPDLFGYWFDSENGISNTYGFFEWLNRQSLVYTTAMGNPLETWLMPIEGTTDHAGLDYSEIDYMLLSKYYYKPIRTFYKKRFIYTAGNPSSRWDAVYNITRMYSKKWLDLWNTLWYTYNPIENYNMREELIDQITEYEHGHVEELLHGHIEELLHGHIEELLHGHIEELLHGHIEDFLHGHTETLTNGKTSTRTGSVKETPGVTTTDTKSVKGFDSANFVDTDKNVNGKTGFDTTEYQQLKDTLSGNDVTSHTGTDKTTNSGTDKTTNSGTDKTTNSGTDKTTHSGTDKTTHSGTDTETKNYTLTRSGNVGVTTTQQMIEQERKILMFEYFNQIVFPDIDKEINLQIY